MSSATDILLVADIGGTNTRVGLVEGATLQKASIRRYRNADYPGIEPVLRSYLADAGLAGCAGACVAAAGPVRDGVAELTNLDWTMSEASIGEAAGARVVALLNDLQAPGYALATLPPSSLRQIIAGPDAGDGGVQDGSRDGGRSGGRSGTRLVMNVGTGFNAVPVHTTKAGRVVPASECGHVSLPVRHADELSLLAHIEAEHGFPSVEDVLSGRGLELVDRWAGKGASPRANTEITAAALAGGDARAAQAAGIFVRLMAVVAGNLALTHLPFGGIYLTGGVVRHFAPHLIRFGFEAAYFDKGRFSAMMRDFPVWAIEDDYAPLHGCAAHLIEKLAG